MAVQQVSIFNQITVPGVENQSATFTNGLAFYLIAPFTAVEYEIDIFLQIRLSPTITRMVRLEPMNISNTERLTLIPNQLRDLGLPMYLAIFPSEVFSLEVILLQDECSLSSICADLQLIKTKLEILEQIDTDINDFIIPFLLNFV
jgi:hypothetical protein